MITKLITNLDNTNLIQDRLLKIREVNTLYLFNILEFMKIEYEDGSYFEGDTLNGILDGHGKFYFANKAHYEGQFRNDRMHGLGKLFYQNGKLAYEGEWQFNTFDGQGTLYNEKPEKIQGGFNYKDFNNL